MRSNQLFNLLFGIVLLWHIKDFIGQIQERVENATLYPEALLIPGTILFLAVLAVIGLANRHPWGRWLAVVFASISLGVYLDVQASSSIVEVLDESLSNRLVASGVRIFQSAVLLATIGTMAKVAIDEVQSGEGVPLKNAFWRGLIYGTLFIYGSSALSYVAVLTGDWTLPVGGPFIIASAILIYHLAERLIVDQDGFKVFLVSPRLSVAQSSWQQCHVTEIMHGGKLGCGMVRFPGLLKLPMTWFIRPGRYDSEELGKVLQRNASRSIAFPRLVGITGFILIVLGVVMLAFGQSRQAALMNQFVVAAPDLSGFAGVLGAYELTALHLVAVALIGAGLGTHSAFHTARVRFVVFAFWMVASSQLPDPMIHFLVWIALASILLAIRPSTDPQFMPSMPNPDHLPLAIDLLRVGPVFAAVAYYVALVIVRDVVAKHQPRGSQ